LLVHTGNGLKKSWSYVMSLSVVSYNCIRGKTRTTNIASRR
jgi:hypothetical protein